MSTYSPNNVWLAFDEDDSGEASHEANIVKTDSGYAVEWSLTAVGLVKSVWFRTHDEAVAWLETEDFYDFTA